MNIISKNKKDKLRIAKTLTNMKYRCNNPNYHAYHRYGGRGIKVCKEWVENPKSFIEWSLNNGYDNKKSIDRIDVNKGYFPDNCRWVDMKTQQNNRGNNVVLFYEGEYHTMSEWSKILEIDYATIKGRYYKGWEVSEILGRDKNSHRALLTLYGETKYLTDWSKELNIEISTLRHRVKNGFSDEEIINGIRSKPKSTKPKIKLKYNGKEQSLLEWSKELGVNRGTLYGRYHRGWTNEEILYGKGLSSDDKRIYLEYNNKRLSLKDWGKIVDLHPDTLRKRMKKGWSVEQILYGKDDK